MIIKEKLPTINPIIYGNMDIYTIRFEKAIGKFENKDVTDLLVRVVSGTDIIISAHPLVLSSKFNAEGYQQDLSLKYKRKTNKNKLEHII